MNDWGKNTAEEYLLLEDEDEHTDIFNEQFEFALLEMARVYAIAFRVCPR